MSAREIITELPKLTERERREIARLIFEMSEDAHILEEARHSADMAFLMLDKMEEEDATRTVR